MLNLIHIPDIADSSITSSMANLCQNRLRAELVSIDPGLPPRLASLEPHAQCDCACLAVGADFLPRLQAPVSFYLELTPHCNNHCFNCGNVFSQHRAQQSSEKYSRALTGHQWIQILHKLKPLAHNLSFTGGEPTLHPEFESITSTASSLEMPFTVFTNGLWDAPQRLCAHLADLSVHKGLLVSLHGPTAESHDAFTGNPGSFVRTLANINTAVQAGLNTSISCVITRYNWSQIEDMVEIAAEYCVGGLVFNRLLDSRGGELMPEPRHLRSAVRTIQTLRASGKAVKLGNCLPSCFVSTDQAGCLAGLAFFTVDPWGRVRPCNHAQTIWGDLLHQPVDEIWQSPVLERWRNSHPNECETCSAFASCRGGCRALATDLCQAADPLMTVPLNAQHLHKEAVLHLYEQARPKRCFSLRPEGFGMLLLGRNRLYPIGSDMQAALASIDGNTTLRQIGAVHGQSGLNLVASLYCQGMVELQIP